MEQDSVSILCEQQERKIKVILIGDQSVGKSKLMECLLNIESKVNDKQIQSVDFFISRIMLPNKITQKIHVWITSGEIKNIAMIRAFLLQSNIYIIAFSLNNMVTLENALNTWFQLCVKNAKQTNAYYYFLGTMGDLERKCPKYNEIINQINEKCAEYKVAVFGSKNAHPVSGIRQSEKWNDDHIIEFATKRLPQNVYYSECSATENLGMDRSMSIFTKLIMSAMDMQDKLNGIVKVTEQPTTAKPQLQSTQDKRPSAKIEIRQQPQEQQEKMCCKIF
ncbi:unnamed protein product (macronuclear) [Paramecium tetraurelia]|uniref:Uncharacterized protein n=1 Tax=Paramecium tetraurelia TaxID=5888 RepID=A0C5M0_PARTE|nr:uncharacterized protein GSPATT00035216001 [Paramecium tetraurelia]CAK66087.1 unnamed protein product [Paramecium tetraurelia]|eukprot:XP_001433484.1 hypothetical protein (macronuclear) [Paramecium tetraurelia strain d4-2]